MDVLKLLNMATEFVDSTPEIAQEAASLHQVGFGILDAIHLAYAVAASATTMLTVDDRLLRRANLQPTNHHLVVENPLDWWRRRQPWLIKR